jgi:hypothetical protein
MLKGDLSPLQDLKEKKEKVEEKASRKERKKEVVEVQRGLTTPTPPFSLPDISASSYLPGGAGSSLSRGLSYPQYHILGPLPSSFVTQCVGVHSHADMASSAFPQEEENGAEEEEEETAEDGEEEDEGDEEGGERQRRLGWKSQGSKEQSQGGVEDLKQG